MTDEPEFDATPPPAEERETSALPLYLLLLLAAVTLLVLQLRRQQPPNEFVGQPMPPLEVAGWLNADSSITNESLRGKLVLVDYWETTCPACVLNMPSLVKLKDKYREQGLVVIGLTQEPDEPFKELSQYVKSVPGLDWPVGYGAGIAFNAAGIIWLPTYVLYDGAGRAVWGGHDVDELEDTLVKQLARG
jgi:thiol-disulfide isomerase/thioredoxin